MDLLNLTQFKSKCGTAQFRLSLFFCFPATTDIVIEVDELDNIVPSWSSFIIYVCLEIYLWSKFPQNKPKLRKSQKPSGSRHTFVDLSTDYPLLWKFIRSRIITFWENFKPPKICTSLWSWPETVLSLLSHNFPSSYLVDYPTFFSMTYYYMRAEYHRRKVYSQK